MSFQTRTQSCPTNQMKKELGSHIKERRGAPERGHPGRRGLVHTRPPGHCPASPTEHRPFGSSSLPIRDPIRTSPPAKGPAPQSTPSGTHTSCGDEPQSRSDPTWNRSAGGQPRVPRPLLPLPTVLDNTPCPAPPGPQRSHILSHAFLKSKGATGLGHADALRSLWCANSKAGLHVEPGERAGAGPGGGSALRRHEGARSARSPPPRTT